MCLVLYTLTPFVPSTPMPSSNHYSIIHSLVHYKPSTNVSYYHCCCHLYPHYKRMRLMAAKSLARDHTVVSDKARTQTQLSTSKAYAFGIRAAAGVAHWPPSLRPGPY